MAKEGNEEGTRGPRRKGGHMRRAQGLQVGVTQKGGGMRRAHPRAEEERRRY
jgi:hypothetical protein